MRSLILALGVFAVIPGLYYPLKANWKNLGGFVFDWEWALYLMEILVGQVLAVLAGLVALALALGGKRTPLLMPPLAMLGVLYGFWIASKYSHDWGHDLFNECGGGRLERTLVPYCVVAVIAFGGITLFDAVNLWNGRRKPNKMLR